MVLRVSPAVSLAEGETEVVTLDKRRRQVTLVDPQTRQAQESRVGVAAPKMFAFDQVYTQEDSQVSCLLRFGPLEEGLLRSR